MKIARRPDGSVVIRASASLPIVLCLLGAAVVAAVWLQQPRDWTKVGLGALGSLVPFTLAAGLDRGRFDFDAAQRRLRWRRANLFRTLSGELAFDAIAGVDVRTRLEASGDDRRRRPRPVHRVVLATPAGELPLSNAWTGDERVAARVAETIRGVLGLAPSPTPSGVDPDIASLIAAGDTIAAVQLVRARLGLDLAEATRWVGQRSAPSNPPR